MKKLFKCLCILLVLILCACNCDNEEVPVVVKDDYKSLKEVNEVIGSSLMLPNEFEVIDESFYILDKKIGAYDFTYGEYLCSLKASKVLDKDISEIQIDKKPAFDSFNNEYSLNTTDKNLKVGRFVIKDIQYAFSMEYNGLSNAIFEDTINAIRQNIFNYEFADIIQDLAGIYYDESGTRAEATIKILVNNVIAFDITVPKSGISYEEYIIFSSGFNGTRIKYDEYLHVSVEEKDSGEETTNLDDSASGYFEVIDGKLYWTGASISENSKCIFIKKVS